jgi:DNA polymerase III subunit gamma/tau
MVESPMTEPLHTKHRPIKFDQVVGQDAVVASMQKIIERRTSRSFLLHGPSGTGKTTLARIGAKALGCLSKDILEIDAASRTGVDDMRQVQETLRYKPFGKGTNRAIIIDEVHRLSKQAFDSMLKTIEEPPPHIAWFLCTTELGKVPETIKTRCTAFNLKAVPDQILGELYERIIEKEKLGISIDVADIIIREANGSPRQMLVNLEICREAKTKKVASELLHAALQSDATRELCQFLLKGGSWLKAMSLVAKLEDENPESIRIIIANYMAAVAKKASSEREACNVLRILDAFAEPFNQSEKAAPLIVAIGRVLFAGE